jgi:RING-box protein 1
MPCKKKKICARVFKNSKKMAEEKKIDIVDEVITKEVREDSSGAAATGMRFEIKKWNAVTMWSWDICADTCAICRNSLNEPSIEYQVDFLFII